MALDWTKPISFGGKSRKSDAIPSKKHMNLMERDSSEFSPQVIGPAIIILAVLVALFAKFGVYDQLARINAKQGELNTQQVINAKLDESLVNYDQVKSDYEGYVGVGLNMADIDSVLALVDTQIAPSATVNSVALTGNTLTVGISDITLEAVGGLSSTLESQDIVQSVSVSTAASTTSTTNVVASVVITLTSPDTSGTTDTAGTTDASASTPAAATTAAAN